MSENHVPEVDLWSTPLRVNLRYAPHLAWVRLTGQLLGANTAELERILIVLGRLPAPVEVDLGAVEQVDSPGVAVITDERSRRMAGGAPPLFIGNPGRFGAAF